MDNGASSYRRFRDEGDEQAFAELIRDYRDGLVYYLCSIVGNVDVAEDIAEDTFVLLGTRKPRDKGNSSFKTWLYTIGRNQALNYLRHLNRKQEVSLQTCEEMISSAPTLEQMHFKSQQSKRLHSALNALKPGYRQALWLVYFEALPVKDVAWILKKSVHSTEMLLHRAKKSLKLQLEKEGFIYEKL